MCKLVYITRVHISVFLHASPTFHNLCVHALCHGPGQNHQVLQGQTVAELFYSLTGRRRSYFTHFCAVYNFAADRKQVVTSSPSLPQNWIEMGEPSKQEQPVISANENAAALSMPFILPAPSRRSMALATVVDGRQCGRTSIRMYGRLWIP